MGSTPPALAKSRISMSSSIKNLVATRVDARRSRCAVAGVAAAVRLMRRRNMHTPPKPLPPDFPVTPADVVDAERRVKPHVHETPVLTCNGLDELAGRATAAALDAIWRHGPAGAAARAAAAAAAAAAAPAADPFTFRTGAGGAPESTGLRLTAPWRHAEDDEARSSHHERPRSHRPFARSDARVRAARNAPLAHGQAARRTMMLKANAQTRGK